MIFLEQRAFLSRPGLDEKVRVPGLAIEHSPGTCTSHNFPEGGAAASFDSGLLRHLVAEVAGIFNIYKLRGSAM